MLDDSDYALDDLVFYGYESRRQSANASAGLLYKRCNELLARPDRYQTALGDQRRHDFCYERVIIIAHSLGAPVVRTMLLRAQKDGAEWLDKVALVFFAPATAGARAEAIGRLVGNWRPSGILALARIYLLYRWPVVDDLRVGSRFLSLI